VHDRFGDRVGVPQWHEDAIVALPPGAVRLATGDRYPNQAFRLGEVAWGVQYHPEVTVADWQDWMDDWHGSVTDTGLDPVAVAARMAAAQPQLGRLARSHADAFAQVLLGAGRPV
jgi:GMP synthase (glutamine-hydrolysing)